MSRRLTLPALVILLGATAAVAQNPAPQTPQNQPYPQASPQQTRTAVSAADSQQIRQGWAYAQQRLTNLLEGITLTVQQKGKVDSVMLRYQPDFPAGSPENATDSTLIQRWAIILPRLDNEVRIVLTPEQQRTWDRNVEQLRLRRRGVGDR